MKLWTPNGLSPISHLKEENGNVLDFVILKIIIHMHGVMYVKEGLTMRKHLIIIAALGWASDKLSLKWTLPIWLMMSFGQNHAVYVIIFRMNPQHIKLTNNILEQFKIS